MDNLLIFILAALTGFGFTGVATFLYFIWLWSGFVKTEWTTLSSFTALLVYWFYGLFGLVFLAGSVISTVCALAMFWFDMSLEDIQEKAHESVNDARPENERKQLQPSQGDDDISLLEMMREKFCQRTGMTEDEFKEKKQQYLDRYERTSNYFDSVYDLCYSGVIRAREITDEIPVIAVLYYYFDYCRKEINTYIKAILSLKELSKLSRAGFGDPNGTPDFSALQNIDMSTLLGGLEAMGMGGSTDNAPTGTSHSNSTRTSTGTPGNQSVGNTGSALPFPPMGGMGGFDMSQMAALERNMTPEQKRQAEQAAMSMLQNFDLGQMGDMMSMFGNMGGQQPNQNMSRAQKRKLQKLQKKNK